MLDKIKETTSFIQLQTQNFKPSFGIILGSGLGGLVNKIDVKYTLKYSDIPNFPISTVEGHKGNLVFGQLGGKNVVAMDGRFHYYEGYTMKEVAYPVNVMKFLGVETLIVSNASGGMNPGFKVGDVMIIKDHINLVGTNPLIGKNIDALGPRFPSMHEAYDKAMIAQALDIAQKIGASVQIGVYAGLSGPTYETPAEYRWLHIIGADAVGMSTVPEVITAKHIGLKVFGISVISDLGGFETQVVSHEEVLAAVDKAKPFVETIVTKLIENN